MMAWEKYKKIWKGSNWLFYTKTPEANVHYNSIQIGKIENEQSPYNNMWFTDFQTENKRGKRYYSSRQKAVSDAQKFMKNRR